MIYLNNGMIIMYFKVDKYCVKLEGLILYISYYLKQVLNIIFILMFLFVLNFVFMLFKLFFDCVINLGGVDCLIKIIEGDEVWLEIF